MYIYINCSGYTQPLQEVKKKTGADLQFDSNQTCVPGMKILRIRGVPKQIEAAVRLISQMTGVKVCRLIVVIECTETIFIRSQSQDNSFSAGFFISFQTWKQCCWSYGYEANVLNVCLY